MKRFAPLLVLTLLAALSLACQAAGRLLSDETPTPVPSPTPVSTNTPLPPTATSKPCPNGECIVACVNRLEAIVQLKSKKTPRHHFKDDEQYTLVTYQVSGNRLLYPKLSQIPSNLKSYQDDRVAQEAIWQYFAAVIPLDQRRFVTHYEVFTDGEENSLAAVAQSKYSASQWDLNVDILDTADPKDLTFTLIHEFGHLLTLNPDQVTPSQVIFDNPDDDAIYDKEAQACPDYFPGEGCSHKDSYINRFVARFWKKIYAEWLKIDNIENQDTYDKQLNRFYQKYKDQFVTDYAPTSPEEDIAESWSYFVLKPKPGKQTIANQKVLFFYEFPELIDLREQIARNLCDQLEK